MTMNVAIKQYKTLEDSSCESYQELLVAICLAMYRVRYDSQGRVIRPKAPGELSGIRMALNKVDPAWDIFFEMINVFNHGSLFSHSTTRYPVASFDAEIQDQTYFGRKKYPGFFELADIFCQQITPAQDSSK